jgi:hypothetical protein
VYGRISGQAVSNPVLVDGRKAPQSLTLALRPAAQITPQLVAGQDAVVYATRTAAAFPVSPGAVTVPANEPLWGIALEKGQPAGIRAIAPLSPGATSSEDLQGSVGGPLVLGWLQVPPADQSALEKAQGMSVPRVHFTTQSSAREAEPLPGLALLNGAFVLVKSVVAGDGELDLSGRGWVTNKMRARVDKSVVTVVNTPLIARGAASLFVTWSSGSNVVELDEQLGACGGTDPRRGFIEISVAACSKKAQDSCSVMRQETFVPELQLGNVTADDLPPGLYRAEFRYGKLPPVQQYVELRPFQQERTILSVRYVSIYGGLTLGGELLEDEASLKFPSGGRGFADRKGEYRAVLLDTFEVETRIDVTTCRGTFKAFTLAESGCAENQRFDIDVPDNELTINVIDTFTRDALPGSTVKYTIFSKRVPRKPVMTDDIKTTARGAVLHNVPEREIVLEVSHAGYQKQVLKPFTMPRNEPKTIDVELVPLRGSSGRIVSPRPFDHAWLHWFSASSVATEHAEVDADGSFIYSGTHTPEETMVLVSQSHPLWLTRSPALDQRTPFSIPFPGNVPVRTFDVVLPGAPEKRNTFIGLLVGGIRIPHELFRSHQSFRNESELVEGRGPLTVRDILETAPIDVILGPPAGPMTSRPRIDPLMQIDLAHAARTRVTPGVTTVQVVK